MIRLALIGCNRFAEQYAPVASRLENAEFSAIADPDPDMARQAAQALGASISSGGLDELLAQHADDFDAVLVHSANGTHTALCKQAAEAGKHVLVETPIAPSTEQADAIIESCRGAGVRLMVGQAGRFRPAVSALRQSLDSGKLGVAGLVRIHRWESPDENHRQPGDPATDLCGGTLINQIVCEIDLVHWFFGQLPSEVYAVGRCPSDSQRNVWQYVQVHLGFPDGAMALIDYSRTLPKGKDYYSLSLIGSTGAAYADDHRNMQLMYRGGEPSALKTGQGHGHLLAQLQEFVSAIEQKRDPLITGEDGRAAVQVAQAAAASITQRRTTQLIGGRYELV